MQPLTKPDAIRLQFEAGIVRSRDDLFVACSNEEERFDGFARLCRYRAGENPPWAYVDVDMTISDGTLFSPGKGADPLSVQPAFVFTSDDGDITHLPIDGDMVTERITGSGLWVNDSHGWGCMGRIVQIGTRLHACGNGGQVYRRLDSDTWEHIDAGLLQDEADKEDLTLKAIAGVSENEIYVGGWRKNVNDGVLFCWDGRRWISVTRDIPAISNIHVEHAGSVWACGRQGTLLHGNHIDGFRKLLEPDRARTYVSVAVYDGQVFLATEIGLYIYDGGSVRRIQTGLVPDYRDGHILQVADGLLWSIGYADIVHFDGANWGRVPFPGNPPIR
ncbi:hypothetical protein [Rhizobium sp. ICMP 5592]|uniref:hypothetical protein n=1 Tax=Rhizobium sp. ICMP 5592 TaxID=2292445 RepID=UPI001295833A|nr:hypothetical protein [Rhizobium sp. ICMP 5592]MQB41786.1 hypothetical protein [Rhizobium sp. ICMP 5592]